MSITYVLIVGAAVIIGLALCFLIHERTVIKIRNLDHRVRRQHKDEKLEFTLAQQWAQAQLALSIPDITAQMLQLLNSEKTIIVIGRGHSGTRAISKTLRDSGVFMGANLNVSDDLVPPDLFYEACRIFSTHVRYNGNDTWDFSHCGAPSDSIFLALLRTYLSSVIDNTLYRHSPYQGWKLPETTLVYPWITQLFPRAKYIYWVRNPHDSTLSHHVTDFLASFNVPCNSTDDIYYNRAISWKYQFDIVKYTPRPPNFIRIRFEDFLYDQGRILEMLEEFLGFPLARVPVNRSRAGVAKTHPERDKVHFPFLLPAMRELGYEN